MKTSPLREIAKFVCGAEAFHALCHGYLWHSGTTLSVFGITETPTRHMVFALVNAMIAIALGIYAWRPGGRRKPRAATKIKSMDEDFFRQSQVKTKKDKNMKTHKAVTLAVITTCIALGTHLAKAGEQRFGEAIDPKAPKVTLAELVAKPNTYAGQNVVVEGRFAGACGDGDFFFKDKFDIIEVDPPKPEACNLKKGTPVRLYGLVKVSGGSEGGEKTETGEKREATVKIAAKTVEVIK